MYVSSYSTYINTTSSQKNDRYKYEKSDVESKSFDIKSPDEAFLLVPKTPTLPIDYISTPLLLKNKQEIESQKQELEDPKYKNTDKTKVALDEFKKQNIVLNFVNSYKSNSEKFSLFQKPHVALEQTPKIDKELPKKAQEIKENNLRHLMVNTYIANDKYYKITA